MTGSVKLNWRVPSEEWAAFRDYVSREFGDYEGAPATIAVHAMLQYHELDGLVGTLGGFEHTAGEGRDEKENLLAELDAQDRTTVGIRVPPGVKERFKETAAAEPYPAGVVLAWAVHAYRHHAMYVREIDGRITGAAYLADQISGLFGDGGGGSDE